MFSRADIEMQNRVIELRGDGRTVRDIAREVNRSIRTVKKHLANYYRRTGEPRPKLGRVGACPVRVKQLTNRAA